MDKANYEEMKEQHLDMMIQLAFKQMDTLRVQELIDESENDKKDCGEYAQRAYALFLRKMRQTEKHEMQRRRGAKRRTTIRHIAEIAACFIIVLGIIAPFAIARVGSIRSRVIELLVTLEEDHADLAFVESSTFDVPSDWGGLYYPSFIPDGYEITLPAEETTIIEYQNAQGDEICFCELTEDALTSIDTEDAEISYTDINGAKAMVIEKYYYTVIWSTADRYFILDASESEDLALQIARSVKKIQ